MAASAKGIRAGRAFVELFADDSRLVRGLRAAQRRLQRFGATVRKLGLRFLGVAAVAGAAFIPAIKAASALEETMNKFNVVFGENAEAVKAWGDEYGKQVGRSKRQIADFLASTQDLLVPLGFEPGEATRLSKEITRLSVDLASFNNMQDADTLRDLQAALTGSGEVMKKYGVVLSEAAVKQELLNQGINPKNASNQQKAFARLQIILRGTTAAQGDAERSSGSFANQMKRLKARLEDGAAAIGTALLPAITPLVKKLGDVVSRISDWISANPQLVATIAKVVTVTFVAGAALLVLGAIFTSVGAVIGGVVAVLGVLKAAILAILSPVGLVVAAVVGLGAVILTQTKIGAAATDFLGRKFGELKDLALQSWQGIKDAIAAGDLELAFRIVALTLKLLWKQAIGALKKTWIDFKAVFQTVAANAIKFVMDLFGLSTKDIVAAWTFIEKAWVQTTSFLADAWTVFVAGFKKTWNKASGFFKKVWNKIKGFFDKGIDADKLNAEIDRETQRANEAIDEQRNEKLNERDRERRRRLREIDEGRSATERALNDFLDDDKRAEKFRRQKEAIDKEVADAKQELADAVAEAAEKRRAAEKKPKDKKQLERPKPVDLAARTAAGRASVVGSFNPFAAHSLGVRGRNNIPQKQLNKLEQIEKLLRRNEPPKL